MFTLQFNIFYASRGTILNNRPVVGVPSYCLIGNVSAEGARFDPSNSQCDDNLSEIL